MSEKYFNRLQFMKAVELMEIDPIESKRQFIKYLQQYPNDYSAYMFYASLLVTFGEIEESLKIINETCEQVHLTKFDRNSRYVYFKKQLFFAKLRLLSYQEKYSEIYNLMYQYKSMGNDMDIHQVYFYCMNKLNIKGNIKGRSAYSYMFRQMIEYREDDFLEHVKKHMADYNVNVEEPNQNIFAADFPIYEIINEVRKYMPSNNKLFRGFITDRYTFKYSDCGRDNNRIVDYFNVICFHNTADIITMCPITNGEYLPYVNLNYMKHDKEDIKIKRRSQIDKFNARYNR